MEFKEKMERSITQNMNNPPFSNPEEQEQEIEDEYNKIKSKITDWSGFEN